MNFRGPAKQTTDSTSIEVLYLDLLMPIPALVFIQYLLYAWLSWELNRVAVHEGPASEGWSWSEERDGVECRHRVLVEHREFDTKSEERAVEYDCRC